MFGCIGYTIKEVLQRPTTINLQLPQMPQYENFGALAMEARYCRIKFQPFHKDLCGPQNLNPNITCGTKNIKHILKKVGTKNSNSDGDMAPNNQHPKLPKPTGQGEANTRKISTRATLRNSKC